jgi:cell division protein FtsW (lipid II flippase)
VARRVFFFCRLKFIASFLGKCRVLSQRPKKQTKKKKKLCPSLLAAAVSRLLSLFCVVRCDVRSVSVVVVVVVVVVAVVVDEWKEETNVQP